MNAIENKVIKLSDLVNENFNGYWKTKKSMTLLSGGRSSFKSSNISLKLVYKFLQDDQGNIICFRKVGKYLRTSVYEQIKWAIIMLGVQDEFQFGKSPLEIRHKRTNTCFYFFGVDEPQKIKSHKIAVGYIMDLWFEELPEFESKEEIDTVVDTFIRQELPEGKEVNVHFSYNPPRNPYNWVNEWVEELKDDDDYYLHHSTYEDDKKGFLSEQFLRKVRKVKETDPEYHDWMYGGKVIGLGDIVYNSKLINIVDKVPEDDRIILADIAIDTGYSVSSTAYLFIGFTIKGKSILLDTYYYCPENLVNKKAPSDFSIDLWEFSQKNISQYNIPIDQWTSDSADGAIRNQFYKDYGIRLHPVNKKTKIKMIENVQDVMAQNRLYMLDTENNKVFFNEHKKYQWDPKKLKTDKPEVIKVDDHTCDAYQYYVNDNLQKLGLK